MSQEKNYLTADGAVRLKKELEQLKGPGREEISKRLRAAIEQGDLSENADYIVTKEEQGFLEGKIIELEILLKSAVIIDDLERLSGEVTIGSHVTIQEDDYPPETYHLVGSKEASPSAGTISYESPIGKAIIGGKEGDEVIVEIPDGEIKLKILKVG
ncbi:MAG: transcription elongation factor GreA [Anaerolineaceae bacterium]|jgi:transcription elongation factor GreA|nr:transcription elongation factor GreA [Anaerolineaceae bacterium]